MVSRVLGAALFIILTTPAHSEAEKPADLGNCSFKAEVVEATRRDDGLRSIGHSEVRFSYWTLKFKFKEIRDLLHPEVPRCGFKVGRTGIAEHVESELNFKRGDLVEGRVAYESGRYWRWRDLARLKPHK